MLSLEGLCSLLPTSVVLNFSILRVVFGKASLRDEARRTIDGETTSAHRSGDERRTTKVRSGLEQTTKRTRTAPEQQ